MSRYICFTKLWMHRMRWRTWNKTEIDDKIDTEGYYITTNTSHTEVTIKSKIINNKS